MVETVGERHFFLFAIRRPKKGSQENITLGRSRVNAKNCIIDDFRICVRVNQLYERTKS